MLKLLKSLKTKRFAHIQNMRPLLRYADFPQLAMPIRLCKILCIGYRNKSFLEPAEVTACPFRLHLKVVEKPQYISGARNAELNGDYDGAV